LKRTKIVATLGPASANEATVAAMIKAGADAFRVNFSHGDEEAWERYAKLVRVLEERLEKRLALIGDLTGPALRIGKISEPMRVERGLTIEFRLSEASDGSFVPIPQKRLFDEVEEGDEVLIDEGRIRLRVTDVGIDSFKAQALIDGLIKPRKNLALFGKELGLPSLTDRDIECAKFAVAADFDYLAMSFVRTGSDVRRLKEFLDREGGEDVKVIAKIETKSGVENLASIASEADAIMVARGDLGNFFPLEEIPSLQRDIIRTSLSFGRPVIIATQLLESMIANPVPTRSEVVDVMEAVREGVDALMLAGETAMGNYPVEAIRWMRRIIEKTESDLTPTRIETYRAETLYDRFARGIALLAESMGAKIAVYTRSGRTAVRISRYRPTTAVYAATGSVKVARQMSMLWGVSPIVVEARDRDEALENLLFRLKEEKLLSFGDIVVIAFGIREGATEVVRIVQV